MVKFINFGQKNYETSIMECKHAFNEYSRM